MNALNASKAGSGKPLPANHLLPYCNSRLRTIRWPTREVMVGDIGVGGNNPLRVQSMTTTLTEDIEATVRQTIELAEQGCDIVRITAPTTKAARCLGEIRRKVHAAGIRVPLVADIHFAPKAAMEAVKHVDKIRINPGNYADRKKFAVKEYSDSEYDSELQRLHEEFSPIVLECKQRGKSMRIGTNHGSLSDRIMNRYGDSPEGMVQSALEFIRIAESHGYHDIILSMKASNPKVMIAAYRLAVARMAQEGMNYPLHLGVTEAGDGEDGRVKSAIGIGSLLYDGIGDTLRVSLTEDPVREVPIGKDLADRAMSLWSEPDGIALKNDTINPYDYIRRPTERIDLGDRLKTGHTEVPCVITPWPGNLADEKTLIREVCSTQSRFKDARIEILSLTLTEPQDLERLTTLAEALYSVVPAFELNIRFPTDNNIWDHIFLHPSVHWLIRCPVSDSLKAEEVDWHNQVLKVGATPVYEMASYKAIQTLQQWQDKSWTKGILTLQPDKSGPYHPLGSYRMLAQQCAKANIPLPVWIQIDDRNSITPEPHTSARLLEASMLAGPLLCDGIGDLISCGAHTDLAASTALAFTILQGTRTRVTRTEYVACPSCGRTLFDLQTTTRSIREKTNHLKGVTIAIMGCIVNGPGEMADADFGYVGGAPGKINLYVGKECVKIGIPQKDAVDRLIDLIREHGKWVDPS